MHSQSTKSFNCLRFVLSPECRLKTWKLNRNVCRSQIEPGLAILCACLVILRPLFINLNLKSHVAKFSTRFKGMPFSKIPSSTDPRGEHGSQPQWPAVRGPCPENKKIGDSDNLPTVKIDLKTRDMESQDTLSSNSV